MKYIGFLIFFIGFTGAEGTAMAKNISDQVILEKYQTKIEKDYGEGGEAKLKFDPWSEVSTPVLLKMFPMQRFYTIYWTKTRARKENEVLLPSYSVVVSIQQKTMSVKEYYHSGNYEHFGELLNIEKIRIDSETQAKNVWDAFCDLHDKHWKDQTVKKISSKKWHLGIITINDFQYYYEVNLDDKGVVLDGKLQAINIKK